MKKDKTILECMICGQKVEKTELKKMDSCPSCNAPVSQFKPLTEEIQK